MMALFVEALFVEAQPVMATFAAAAAGSRSGIGEQA